MMMDVCKFCDKEVIWLHAVIEISEGLYYINLAFPAATSVRTEEIAPGVLVDYGEDDNPVGVEFLSNDSLRRFCVFGINVAKVHPTLKEWREGQ